MYYGNIKYDDIANGPGVRTCLFVSGCTHHCKGCFQPETWAFDFGKEFTDEVADQIIESLKVPWVKGLTVLGGEPMEPANQAELAPFLERVKAEHPAASLWMYTGDTFEDLTDPQSERHTEFTERILGTLDVLVDGLFVEEKKNISLRFRGSENQRLIDIPKTLEAGSVQLWEDDPQFSTHTME